ncbi:MAG: lipopolysaccharide biosynthesis protein [Bacteroidota bacterium]|nr:lipopolysaccharide biosynthesis protein [Bacteroidota bacterium]
MQEQFSEEDIRLVDVLESFKSYFIYILKKWYISILGVAALTLGGYFYAKLTPPKYIANISFNAVDSRATSMGGIMSMMGVSFAGGSSNDVLTGIFTSRNIFYNSMLDTMDVEGKREKIANIYMHAYKYDEGFDQDPEWKGFKFRANSIKEITKKEMDILSVMFDDWQGGLMTAELDAPTGMIKAEIETPDYELSRQLGSTMLKHTLQFYQNKQVENAKISLTNVTKRLDSISGEITRRQSMIAASQDINIFNHKKEVVVDQQKLMQEIATLNIMYNDAASSKENAKVGLSPQNNIVRVVDDPMFSTAPKHLSKLLYTAIGFAASLVLIIIPLLISKAVQDGREEDKMRSALLSS